MYSVRKGSLVEAVGDLSYLEIPSANIFQCTIAGRGCEGMECGFSPNDSIATLSIQLSRERYEDVLLKLQLANESQTDLQVRASYALVPLPFLIVIVGSSSALDD
jgi:hypothetical protein